MGEPGFLCAPQTGHDPVTKSAIRSLNLLFPQTSESLGLALLLPALMAPSDPRPSAVSKPGTWAASGLLSGDSGSLAPR